MSKLHDLAELGQSIWLDYIRRDILDSGELNQLRQSGVRGVTSNPSIFEQAIARSDDYKDDLERLIADDMPAMDIYEALAIEDIRQACDIFIDLYRQTDGDDGYVSLEVNPGLAYDTAATVAEAKRLFVAVDRPNLYIKVPATAEGIPAIAQLIGDGVNVNVTLIFSLDAYEQVAEAYLAGLEALVEKGGNPRDVSSVASFFVSRVDGKVDPLLKELGNSSLLGQIGIANAKRAYLRFQELFSGPRWERLVARGARVQRPLWGSTSTKEPAYPDTLYVDNLIGPHTVNTVPPETLDAIMDHAVVERTIDSDPEQVTRQLEELAALGIDLDRVTNELLEEGVSKFAAAFNSLLQAIEARKQQAPEGSGAANWTVELGGLERRIATAMNRQRQDNVLQRLWQQDYTLWSDDPTEIANRLGWLDIAAAIKQAMPQLTSLVDQLRQEGIRCVVLLGMGGSSLAPELFARTFGVQDAPIRLQVLDTTDPEAISALRRQLEAAETAFVVSSKSGGTIETISLYRYFHHWMVHNVGQDRAGAHFIAITDPGSSLDNLAQRAGFRQVFYGDPDIGGRYAALSNFGLFAAALVGADIERLLSRAQRISGPDSAEGALLLGTIMGEMALAGRNKLTLILSPEIAGFGDWVEQLVAESTGKKGQGILPVVGEPLMEPQTYSADRLFVALRLEGDHAANRTLQQLAAADHPVIVIPLADPYALGEQFVLWEAATAIAGRVLGINPFDQPNVEAAKQRAGEMIDLYREQSALPQPITTLQEGGIRVQEQVAVGSTAAEALANFLDSARPGGYIAIHAYVPPNAESDAALTTLRRYVVERTGLVVTVGYGPRFLHSTGQLHKGDAGLGLFIQLVSEPLTDLPIPSAAGGEPEITFGTLKLAQALGDAQALKDAGRSVIRFVFGSSTADAVARLT